LLLYGENPALGAIVKQTFKERTVRVNETVKFIIQGLPNLMGGIEDGKSQLKGTSCVIDFGDHSPPEKCDAGRFGFPILTHKYAKPSVYVATLKINSTFSRSGTSYSCEYTCTPGTVEAPVKVVAEKEETGKR